MAYRKIKVDEVPRRDYKRESRFERTEDWKLLKADIDRGFSDPKDVLEVTISPEELESLGIKGSRTVARFVQKYIASKGLDYVVRSFRRDGLDHINVQTRSSAGGGK